MPRVLRESSLSLPNSETMLQIILVRHGESSANVDRNVRHSKQTKTTLPEREKLLIIH